MTPSFSVDGCFRVAAAQHCENQVSPSPPPSPEGCPPLWRERKQGPMSSRRASGGSRKHRASRAVTAFSPVFLVSLPGIPFCVGFPEFSLPDAVDQIHLP